MPRDPDHPAVRSAPAPSPACGSDSFEDIWAGLEPAFRHCLELAWASARAGSLGIGCVITASAGETVATGRNRLFESDCGDDHLAGSPVAHAEMNALGKLRAGADHRELTLWTSLEPCLLCAGGIRLARVGRVCFLAADPLWNGMAEVLSSNPFGLAHGIKTSGPRPGELAGFAMLLPFHAWQFWAPGSDANQLWHAHSPALGDLAVQLAASHELVALAAAAAPVTEVIRELWGRLGAAVGTDPGDALA